MTDAPDMTLEIALAQRDNLRARLEAVLKLVDSKGYLTAKQQSVVWEAHAALQEVPKR